MPGEVGRVTRKESSVTAAAPVLEIVSDSVDVPPLIRQLGLAAFVVKALSRTKLAG